MLWGNALIPVMTVIGLGLGNLLGGMVLVETIFKWPGVGQFAYESVMAADYPAIIGVALLIALNYMIINTVVDILYGIIDPRVSAADDIFPEKIIKIQLSVHAGNCDLPGMDPCSCLCSGDRAIRSDHPGSDPAFERTVCQPLVPERIISAAISSAV